MKRVGKVVVLDSIPDVTTTTKADSELKDYLAKLAPEMEPENLSDLPVLDLPDAMQRRLMAHQKIGVRWLHSLFLSGSGGILGDDMGLGKTYQVICLLAGLMQQELVNRILILAPVSVLPNWQRELLEHLKPHIPGLEVFLTNSDLTKKKRIQILDTTFQTSKYRYTPKIVISSYQLVSNMVDDFANRGRWDYVILDEGHVIKNPSTKTSKSMHLLSSNHRLILTGTPIQNNLNEFWAIVNWATKGRRFGTLSGFKEDYTLPIVSGQDPKATPEQRRIADEAAKNLLALIKPIILQRKKCELPSNAQLNLPTKIELVVWSPLATSQRELYEQFIHSRQFSTALNRSTCPVEVINHLKTVCRHPLLIEALEMNRRRRDQATSGVSATPVTRGAHSPRPAKTQISQRAQDEDGDDMEFLSHGLADMSMAQDGTGEEEGELQDVLKSLPTNASVFDVVDREPDVKELLRGSIKLRILLKLVHRLHYAGHRTLVFSQSRLMLDIIQRVFVEYGLASHRIDGSVRSSERQRIIDEYNDTSDDSIGPSICLLTTKACGFGITLTGADRVIIYDPSWNPAEDRQAVDRAYRIGQTKPVVVYRLIMASSVEEKMYEKQVFKDGIRVVTESGTSSRYFSRDETSELFKLGPVDQSVVMERLWTAAGGQSLREFPDTRGELPSVLGFTRHDTLYTEARPDAASQGSDPYSQFVDKEHQPSDDEEDYVGVPPTPAPKIRTKAAPVSAIKRTPGKPVLGKENILDGLNKMRNLADIAAQQKQAASDAMDLSPFSAPKSTKPNRYSTAFDLSSPTPSVPVRDPRDRFSMSSQVSDLTCDTPLQSQEEFESDFQQLSNSKLYRGDDLRCEEPADPAEPADALENGERVGTPRCTDSDDEDSHAAEEMKQRIESLDNNEDSIKEEASVWSKADVAAFNALKEQKLFTPPVSPNKQEISHQDRVASPSMTQFETQQDFESTNYEAEGREYEEAPESLEYETASEASDADQESNEVGQQSNFVVHSNGEDDDLDPIDRLLQSVLVSGIEGRSSVSTAPADPECATQQDEELHSQMDQMDQMDQCQEEIHQVQDHEEGLDPDSEEDLASAATAFLAEFTAQLSESAQEGCDDTVVSAGEELEVEQEVNDDGLQTCREEMEHYDRPSTPLLGSECSSQADEEDWPAEDATCASEVGSNEPPGCDFPVDDEVDGADSFSDEEEEDEERFKDEEIAGQALGFTGRESVKPRLGGGYLLNLCEMGSMKRTSSMHSNQSASSDNSAPLRQVEQESSISVAVANDSSSVSFSSPKISASQEGEARLSSGAITTRKPKKSPIFNTYMEPDLFASPPWNPSSILSPPLVTQSGSDASYKSAVMASGGTEVDETSSLAPSSQVETTFHDPLQDLVDQVRDLKIANAPAAATPVSKISFQTTGGQYSNMIIKAQSVNRMQRSFALLSDSESDDEDENNCTPTVQSAGTASPGTGTVDRLTPTASHSPAVHVQSPCIASSDRRNVTAPATGGTLCSEGDDVSLPSLDGTSPARRQSSIGASHAPFPRTALFLSPQRRRSSAAWRRLSTGTMVSVGEDSVATAGTAESADYSDDEAEREENEFQDAQSTDNRSPLSEVEVEEDSTAEDLESINNSSDNSQTSAPSVETVSYDVFQSMVVPPLAMDHNCVTDSNKVVLRTLGLDKLDLPVRHPHCFLSEDNVDEYNDLLILGRDHESVEDFVSAAVAYAKALELCDEVVALHGKLAWLLQKIDI